MNAAELSIWDGSATMEHFADVRGAFHVAYPRRSVADFRDALTVQAASAGFMAVAAYEGRALVGCVYGLPLSSGGPWWAGLDPHQSDDFVFEDGLRTFALLEFCGPPGGDTALGGRLVRALLSRRREKRATTKSPAVTGVNSLPWGRCGSVPGSYGDVPVSVLGLPI
ncbi:hypothetical protein GCM10022223_45430 [Kineosporia mesophila]|uniref:N-acetyltransferase domain-containing protein n=1 Tax=Kineosporia mesophila TaxID=566012 RepID=A0ABP7A203_9ACTN|nr:hypothetical protein [Kineosporia mesophila]MCD5348962.1 hypothetical protein [Kineosporia mesophila]